MNSRARWECSAVGWSLNEADKKGMENMDDRENGDLGFWRSKTGLVAIAFIIIVGILLTYEHRVHLFTGSGFLVLLLLACVGIHLFMHGGHGGHGDQGSDKGRD